MTADSTARTIRRTIVRAGLRSYEAAYDRHARLAEHEHESPFFTYVLRGDYVEHVGGSPRECRRGAVIFHHPHEVHSDTVGTLGTASLNVEIPVDQWHELTADVVRKRDLVGRVLSGDVEWAALVVWREFHRDDRASAMGLSESVALLSGRLVESHARGSFEPHQRLDRCLDYLSAHAAEAPTLIDVARVAGVHPMHLAKLFRRRFGYSMGEYVRRLRIAWACDQLGRDVGTIGSIAADAGFADHAHFTRTFRRLTGTTPRWYRNHVGASARNGASSVRHAQQALQSRAQHSAPAKSVVSSHELLVDHAPVLRAQNVAQPSRFLEDVAAGSGLVELERSN
jgi:AraC family transcriptional regulator